MRPPSPGRGLICPAARPRLLIAIALLLLDGAAEFCATKELLDEMTAAGSPLGGDAGAGEARENSSLPATPPRGPGRCDGHCHEGRDSSPRPSSPSSSHQHQHHYAIPSYFSFDRSTQENYGEEKREFHGPFKEIRAALDFEYHGNYKDTRQAFQDRIVEKLLERIEVTDSETGAVCKTPTEPWIVFTAGVMGAGKGHVVKQLFSRGLFPRRSFIVVDPDEIRSHFTEYHVYARVSPNDAGNLTHREAGYIAEIVTEAAMRRGYNVLVDGSLWDHEWYGKYFGSLRRRYPALRIAILHVTAPREAVLERAAHRAQTTGRVVPVETLERSLRRVPVSVGILAPMADFFVELDNSSGEPTMAAGGVTWEAFQANWAQTCPQGPRLEDGRDATR